MHGAFVPGDGGVEVAGFGIGHSVGLGHRTHAAPKRGETRLQQADLLQLRLQLGLPLVFGLRARPARAHRDLFYPGLNRMALELVVHGGRKGWRGLDPARTQAVRQSLAQRTQTDPDVWSSIGQLDVELYEALAEGRLAASLASLAAGYANIHARLNANKAWRTVADQARIVLGAVLARTRGKEQAAAQALLDQLLGYARGPAGR